MELFSTEIFDRTISFVIFLVYTRFCGTDVDM